MQNSSWDNSNEIGFLLHDLYPPFQIGDMWNENRQQDMEDVAAPQLLSNEPFCHTSLNFDGPPVTKNETRPAESELKFLRSTLNQRKHSNFVTLPRNLQPALPVFSMMSRETKPQKEDLQISAATAV
jgi:hypothetical protein